MGRPEGRPFDNMSPLDFRYWNEVPARYLSEEAYISYKLRVEQALAKVLVRYGLCSQTALEQIDAACGEIDAAIVYALEDKITHDIRSLVGSIRERIPEEARFAVHLGATSYDIIDSANALRFRDAMLLGIIPALIKVENLLIDIVEREADTLQIGRTHGQHAVPITFGFAFAEYVSRLGGSINELPEVSELPGKFSGPVGSHSSMALFVDDPMGFEREVLTELGLVPLDHSTQIVQPEPVVRLVDAAVRTAGVLANIARDIRNLQRTEIAEVGEFFGDEEGGSSAMPQKVNPEGAENVESENKILLGRIVTVHLDAISEHQRDLTNSASSRTTPEIFAYLYEMARRMTRILSRLQVNRDNMMRNVGLTNGRIMSEPMQVLLGSMGHPRAYDTIKTMTRASLATGQSLISLFENDPELAEYRSRMTPRQRLMLTDYSAYTAIAGETARGVARTWRHRMKSIVADLLQH